MSSRDEPSSSIARDQPPPPDESHADVVGAAGHDDPRERTVQDRKHEDAVLARELADRELARSLQAEDDLRYEVQLNLTRPRYDGERLGGAGVRPWPGAGGDWEDDYFDYDIGDAGEEDGVSDRHKDAEKESISGASGRGTTTSATASLTTDAETESILSCGTNLSIAGRTTTATGPSSPQLVGIGGASTTRKNGEATSAVSAELQTQRRRHGGPGKGRDRFDPFRDDPVNRCLLGRWDKGGRGGGGRREEGGRLDVPALFRVLTESSFQETDEEDSSASASDDGISRDSDATVCYDHKNILDEYAMRRYRVGPTYARVKGNLASCNPIVYEVYHPSDPTLYGTGHGDSEHEGQSQAAADALMAISNVISAGSLRGLASTLPFAVRFQLERAVLGDGGIVPSPTDDAEARRGCIWAARNVLIDFIARVLPPLLEASFDTGDGGGPSITLGELFANEIFDDLADATRCVVGGKAVTFSSKHVLLALDSARHTLDRAESHCGGIEADLTLPLFSLDGENNCDLTQVQRRSLWPMAEYTARFDPRMEDLVPTNLEVLNGREYLDSRQAHVTGVEGGGGGTDGIPPLRMSTRRLLREHGFPVRDRFVRISRQQFPRPDVDGPRNLVRSLRSAGLCGRRYVYLFDKGPGRPNIWLFAEKRGGDDDSCPWTTRQGLLRCIGDFKKVPPEKWGDRISLAFSVTAPVMELSLKHIVIAPELTRGGFRFSDGCGLMGTNVAREIQRVLGIAEMPGAVQIRIGGCKGMLSVVVSPNVHPDSIGLRPSQVKFPSEHRILEVKRVARAGYRAYDQGLFGQSLLVLDYLGVPTRIFCELQERACAQLVLEHDKEALSTFALSPSDAHGSPRSGQPDNRSNLDINISGELKYVRGVLRTGRKADGSPFTQSEFDAIEDAMKNSTGKINLRCDVALMLGVADELGLLEENEVLVGNGLITGRVLICRSPCNVPGDVQAAVAMPRQTDEPYTYLGNVVIFSSKGSRPLPDMLGGGDLDGDEYFIIHEESLVQAARTCPPKDYGTRSDVPRTKNFHQAFMLPLSEKAAAAVPPSLDEQLAVLQRYMAMGNLVAESGRAWALISGSFGVGCEEAMNMADLHQKALDARTKVAFGRDGEMDAKVARMRHILHRARGGDTATSIVDILHDYWRLWMLDLAIARSNIYPKLALSANATVERMTINATRRDRIRQLVERREDEKLLRLRLGTLPDGNQQEQHGRQLIFDAYGGDENPLECLVDLVFGRRQTSHMHDAPPAGDFWRGLGLDSLEALREMVLIDFATNLEDAWNANDNRESSERWRKEPHCYDVFVMEPELRRRNIRLAVCWPTGKPHGRDRGLVWRDEHDNYIPLDPPFHAYRVANLSGTARTLESLSSRSAIPGSLMHYAMGRKMLVNAADEQCAQYVNNSDHGSTASMNCSQKLAVATALRKDFEKGFFVVQGPPGCGKTRVLVGIICALGKGIAVAPSNAAVANLALQLVSCGFEIRDICVYGENCDPSVHFLNPQKRGQSFQTFIKSYRDLDNEADKITKLHEFASWLRIKRKNVSMEEIAAICPFVGNDQGVLSKLLASAKVVLCTLNTSGAPVLRRMLSNRFDTLLFDEAGQCPEAEFYIATTFPGVRRIIVVGDPSQLPATVKHPWCKRAGYGESWMEHVQKYQMDKVHLLDTQYRMDPAILCFPNMYFYANRISSSDSVSNRKPIVHAPFRLIDAKGSEEKEKHSYKNSFEVIVIKSLLQSDSDIRRVQRKTKFGAKTIIITPYQAQVDLLRQELRKVKSLKSWAVSTVDNIQGGEGDIVILSMVRTEAIGFADDPQRLNVALTRAKRVLRVVGNVGFFQTLKGSALSHLWLDANKYDSIETSKVHSEKWQTPDWTKHAKAWKPFMTQKFQHCVRNMSQLDKHVAFNTLIAVATPAVKDLVETPHGTRKTPCWQLSALRKGADRVQIVWAAKAGNDDSSKDNRPIVEAHFAGSRGECNRFMQVHSKVPEGSCVVLAKLAGIELKKDKDVPTHNSDITWAVTNETQDYVVSNPVGDLPDGTFRLDPQQEKVLTASLPLLLESRSCTGKTNVLFQHAVAHAKRSSTEPFDVMKPIAFITVSPNLRRELERRYKEVESMEKVTLPPIKFFSLRDLLDGLLTLEGITDMNMSNACSFLDYVNERRDHSDLAIEQSLVENEIGGVILGSLSSAEKRKPLSRRDYMREIRSNVPNHDDAGRRQRKAIYDEYDKYRKWKLSQNRYDVNDVVIRLLGIEREQIFESAYLDEIQDFSYAAIFLICSIAGKETLHWVCAGDTAQMISPGCSFKFDGLKQTMLAVRPGIEMNLGKISHLLTNYRTTKDVLQVGNAILRQAKKYFPDAIEHSMPEKAVKDLGIEVVLLNWDDAFNQKAKFGPYQALIYTASDNPDRLDKAVKQWLKDHPFILTCLNSKGLEFDDVVVVFDVERKTWDLPAKRIATLRMLRELYVAVTRAKRRVVILVKKHVDTMLDFFKGLGCNLAFAEASIILMEFDSESDASEWKKRGMDLFRNEQYKVAASCFIAAVEHGWSGWARGLDKKRSGQKKLAAASFRAASRVFFESSEFKHTLDVLRELAELPPWQPDDDDLLYRALKQYPDYFSRDEYVKLALKRGAWEDVSLNDLKDPTVSLALTSYRHDEELKQKIRNCSEEDRKEIAMNLPGIVADYHMANETFLEASELFIRAQEIELAVKATQSVLATAKLIGSDLSLLELVVSFWDNHMVPQHMIPREGDVYLLLLLYRTPVEAATQHGKACVSRLGRRIIKHAITARGLEESVFDLFEQTKRNESMRKGAAARKERSGKQKGKGGKEGTVRETSEASSSTKRGGEVPSPCTTGPEPVVSAATDPAGHASGTTDNVHGQPQAQAQHAIVQPQKVLYDLTNDKKWDEASKRCQEYPNDARWNDDKGTLPIHLACYGRAPLSLFRCLHEAYGEGIIRTVGYTGSLPIHLACLCHVSLEVIQYLHELHPDGATKKDRWGTPTDHLQHNKCMSKPDMAAARAILTRSRRAPRPPSRLSKPTPAGTATTNTADVSNTAMNPPSTSAATTTSSGSPNARGTPSSPTALSWPSMTQPDESFLNDTLDHDHGGDDAYDAVDRMKGMDTAEATEVRAEIKAAKLADEVAPAEHLAGHAKAAKLADEVAPAERLSGHAKAVAEEARAVSDKTRAAAEEAFAAVEEGATTSPSLGHDDACNSSQGPLHPITPAAKPDSPSPSRQSRAHRHNGSDTAIVPADDSDTAIVPADDSNHVEGGKREISDLRRLASVATRYAETANARVQAAEAEENVERAKQCAKKAKKDEEGARAAEKQASAALNEAVTASEWEKALADLNEAVTISEGAKAALEEAKAAVDEAETAADVAEAALGKAVMMYRNANRLLTLSRFRKAGNGVGPSWVIEPGNGCESSTGQWF